MAQLENAMVAVHEEVLAAMKKHGPMKSRHEAYAIILEELDEFWDLVKANPSKLEFPELWSSGMRMELVQTAAMCVRALCDLDLIPF